MLRMSSKPDNANGTEPLFADVISEQVAAFDAVHAA